MREASEAARDLVYALDPVRWAADVLSFRADHWQQRMLRTPEKRVLLCCSRQTGKSSSTAVLAAHTALYTPGSLVLLISRAQRQSAELFRKVASALKTARATMPTENATSCELGNGSRVHALPGDRGDTLRGFSAPNLVIFDEAAFALDDVYQAVRPMLAVSSGRLMLLSTPNGRQGFFFKAWESQNEVWHRETIKASECPRISPQFLKVEREEIGEWWFRQEYECEFVASSAQIYSEDAIARAFGCPSDPLTIN